MECKTCLRSGLKREGGLLGVCWKHQKAKCRICGEPSAGSELCAKCAHEEDILRWKNEAHLHLLDAEDQENYLALRKERLIEGKFHVHRAVEILFRGLILSIEALWGDVEPQKNIEHKKAA